MTQTVDLSVPDEGLLGGYSAKKPKKGFEQGNYTQEALKVTLERRKTLLNIDRLTWWPNWLDLGNHFVPMRGRYIIPDGWDTNKGYRRNWSIVDSTPLIAANTLASGLVAGVTSKARPWFQYSVEDEALLEAPGVKEWLDIATKKARAVLARSNFYNCAFEIYREFGVWGMMALGREWPFHEPTPHFQPFTIGSYYVGQDRHRRVNVFFRDFMWTVQQIVDKFAIGPLEDDRSWINISARTRMLWNNAQPDTWIPMTHAVCENYERVKREGVYKADATGMRFRSVYYERGGDPDRLLRDSYNQKLQDEDQRKILRSSGFRDFPVWVARWYTNSEDVIGRGPAMDALGDARALQLQQMRKAQAIDKLVDPPMKAHPSLRNQRTSMLPGDVTFVAPEAGTVGFEPIYPNFKPDIQAILGDIVQTQDRIKAIMYSDIFAMFIQAERTGQPITAAEVNARQQEKLLMLGPVLEQLNTEFLNPMQEWLFHSLVRRGELPPPPKAMRGSRVHVVYTSILANAINAITFQAIQQFTGWIGTIAQMSEQAADNPALDKVDFDAAVEEAARATQVPPSMVRSDADVAQIRQQRAQRQQAAAQQQAQAQAAQNAQAHAGAAQSLSQTQMGNGSALDALAQAVGAGQVPGQ
jgi:Bacteriophage head to tail connecting protein